MKPPCVAPCLLISHISLLLAKPFLSSFTLYMWTAPHLKIWFYQHMVNCHSATLLNLLLPLSLAIWRASTLTAVYDHIIFWGKIRIQCSCVRHISPQGLLFYLRTLMKWQRAFTFLVVSIQMLLIVVFPGITNQKDSR